METFLVVLLVLVVIGLGVVIYNQIKSSSKKVDVDAKLNEISQQVENTMLQNLNSLGQNLNSNFEQGRKELNDIQSKNFKDSHEVITKVMNMIDQRMDKMGEGLGELSKVSDFMQLLFNPSARGKVGEVQLEGLLTDILAPTQFVKNYQPNPSDNSRVEFAVKMPTDLGETVYLPIDSKFPREEYERLLNAESKEDIERSQKALQSKIKEFAKSISKYVNPPHTTDMAIMYLPNGIFDYTISQPELVDYIRNEYKVVIAGTSTLWMILSFVSYFFRLMAVNDKSKEVWTLMSKFKKQMKLTLEVVDKAKRYNDLVGDNLDQLRTTRYNVMMRELREVQDEIEEDRNDHSEAA